MFLQLTRSVLAAGFVTSMFITGAFSQGVKRVVVLKIDGLPGYYLDNVVKRRDAATGKSVLPWVEEVFYKNGTRVPNFYTRGMSLSGPSWAQLDTGQRAHIKGNVEFDRLTLHTYDYLNFIPFYIDYGKNKKVDMPATEVMDQLKIPLFCDAFAVEERYTAQQLFQRGYDWAVFASGFVNMIPRDTGDLIDEWTIGFNVRKMTVDQIERDIEGKLIKRPDINYYDYYDTAFDHTSHHNNDAESRLVPLRQLDRTIGRIWTSIRSSSRADETALVIVSDHGFNSDEKIYSQGFNIVKLLAARSGGGHHVVTKRRLLLDYSLKGIYPLVPLIRTSSHESYYLKGQNEKYPTALVDFDGNERSSVHLRQADLNVIHILLQELRGDALKKDSLARKATVDAVLSIIEKHRIEWQTKIKEMNDELDALGRWRQQQEQLIVKLPLAAGDGVSRRDAEQNRRQKEQADLALEAELSNRKYLQTLSNLVSLQRDNLLSKKFKIEELIAPNSMGDANSNYDLQNYVVGLGEQGIVVDASGKLDLEKSFQRVNYFELFQTQRVRNNVQGIGNRPVDFIAERIPLEEIKASLPSDLQPNTDAIWLYGGAEKQALILKRETNNVRSYRYLPIANLTQNSDGKIIFEMREWGNDLPLKYFEDKNLDISGDKIEWLNNWHSEIEFFRAVHKTKYSNAIIGLNEQLQRHRLIASSGESEDDALIRRFRQRQRLMTEADMFVVANDHWNFDVRGFNPGGNHGSFFRVSTNSTLMLAGGAKTGIPRAFVVNEPYDSLSFVPTILRLMGKVDADGNPSAQLRERGFHQFPGRIITEITGN